MTLGFRGVPGYVRAWAPTAWALAAGWGCQPAPPSGIVVEPPAAWRPAKATDFTVPGTPLAAWTGPRGASLVVYRALPIPGARPEAVAEELANRLANMPGLHDLARRTETWGGQVAARVEAVAPGTGGALAPTGTGKPVAPGGRPLVPTRRVALAFPRPDETLWLAWHFPETARDEVAPQVEATLRGLHLGPSGPL